MSLTVKSFDLLELLVRNPGRLLTKDELLARIWEGADVYDSSLTTHVSMLRQALGDSRESRYIETVSKKGYRFVADVEAVPETPGALSIPEAPSPSELANGAEPVGTEVPSDAGGLGRRPGSSLRSIRVLLFTVLFVVAAVVLAVRYLSLSYIPAPVRLYREALKAEKLGNDNLALEKLKEVLRLKPTFSEANLKAAWICYDDNDNETASDFANAVLNQQGGVSKSVRLQAESLKLLLIGDPNDAFNKLKLAAESEPTDPDAFYALAEQAVDLGLFDDAESALHRCRLADPNNPFCTFQMIVLRVYQDRFSDAVLEYEQAEKSGIRFPWLNEPAGYARLALGDYDGSLKHFRALEEAGKTLVSDVHFRTSQEGIAAVALYQGKLGVARQQIQDALETSKSNYDRATYYISQAEMDALHNRASDAVQEAEKAVRLSDSPDIWISAARIFAMANEFDRASDVLTKHEAMSGTVGKQYPAAEHFIAGLRAASDRSWDKAIDSLSESYRLESRPTTGYYLASSQMSASNWADAAATLDELLRSKGKILMDGPVSLIPLSQLNLAICYQRLGNLTRAGELREALNTMWKDADPELRARLK